jgi:hypothetical protein
MNQDADNLLTILSRHIGAANGISAERLAWRLYGPGATAKDQRHVRKLVVELRRDGHHICADPKRGYFMAQTDEELDGTCQFLFNRAMTSLSQVSAMKRVSLPDLAGQLRIRLEEPTP